MLKGKSIEGQTYERVKNAITTPQFRKTPILEKVSAKLAVDTSFKQLKDNDLVYKPFRDLILLQQDMYFPQWV